MGRTQEERKAETRARLIAAAADLFAHKGFHAVSADAVADAAGRTTGALYAHFGSKEGLLVALLEEWKNQTADDMAITMDSADDFDDRLEALWHGFAELPEERGAAWLLLEHELWLYAARNPEVGEDLSTHYADARERFGAALDEWEATGNLDLPGSGERTATLVMAMFLGLEMQRRVDPPAVDDALAIEGLRALLGLPDAGADG